MEQEEQQLTPHSCLCLLSWCGEEIGATLCHSVPGRTLHSFIWVPTGQPGPGPAAPRAGSSSPHRQGHRFRYSVLLLRYCPCACILGACPSCVPTPPPQPISISTSSRRSSSILAATGELIKNRNSWMNRIHETNKIRKDDHILDDGLVWSSFFNSTG